jgi:hypothetical protein
MTKGLDVSDATRTGLLIAMSPKSGLSSPTAEIVLRLAQACQTGA